MTPTAEKIVIGPQPGRQEQFLSTPADIGIYGGGAGGGKTYGLLLEPLRHYHRPGFGCVMFRREATQIKNEGGLWDESEKLYPYLSAIGSRSVLEWRFPAGGRLKFSHLEHEKDKYSWMGSQIPIICFDELTHFTENQFWYLLSRNRSASAGFQPYVRATCNPDPDSFVARLISWWINQQTGFPIPERSGVLRWFIRVGNDLVWGDSKAELRQKYGDKVMPKSLTFIPATVHDNKILCQNDPSYLASLMALPLVDRERLLGGNWLIRASSGTVFKRQWFEIVDAAPANARRIRYWDRAATVPSSDNPDPDWTAGLRVSRDPQGTYYVEDVSRFRGTSATVETTIKNVASQDGSAVAIGIEQDPGQAGKAEANYYVRALAGYDIRCYPATKDKVTRAKPASAQAEAGNIKLVRGAWNETFLQELENFPNGTHDDQVDALSGAVNHLAAPRKIIIA